MIFDVIKCWDALTSNDKYSEKFVSLMNANFYHANKNIIGLSYTKANHQFISYFDNSPEDSIDSKNIPYHKGYKNCSKDFYLNLTGSSDTHLVSKGDTIVRIKNMVGNEDTLDNFAILHIAQAGYNWKWSNFGRTLTAVYDVLDTTTIGLRAPSFGTKYVYKDTAPIKLVSHWVDKTDTTNVENITFGNYLNDTRKLCFPLNKSKIKIKIGDTFYDADVEGDNYNLAVLHKEGDEYILVERRFCQVETKNGITYLVVPGNLNGYDKDTYYKVY